MSTKPIGIVHGRAMYGPNNSDSKTNDGRGQNDPINGYCAVFFGAELSKQLCHFIPPDTAPIPMGAVS